MRRLQMKIEIDSDVWRMDARVTDFKVRCVFSKKLPVFAGLKSPGSSVPQLSYANKFGYFQHCSLCFNRRLDT